MTNIGIFSGSFNPIHIGHLILANYISEFSDLDEVWFLATPQNPLKPNLLMADNQTRLRMIKESVKNFPKLYASNFEFSLPTPSYTINTLEALEKEYPKNKFHLIIGADNWAVFNKWKDYDKILNNYNIIIYPRLHYVINVPKIYSEKVKVVNAPIIEISSTFIRDAISKGKQINSFVPDGVFAIIQEEKLYR